MASGPVALSVKSTPAGGGGGFLHREDRLRHRVRTATNDREGQLQPLTSQPRSLLLPAA